MYNYAVLKSFTFPLTFLCLLVVYLALLSLIGPPVQYLVEAVREKW